MNQPSPASLPPALVLRVIEAFDAASKDALKQLRTLYALQAAGKRNIEVPAKLDVLVTVKLDDLTTAAQSASGSQIALDTGSQV